MSKRRTWMTISAALALAAILIAGTATIALGNPLTQADATQQQQTIDAVIAERFTQTAAVQQSAGATQTADAATLFAPTLTAAFEATVDAAFNQAITATAEANATATAQVEFAARDQVIAWEGGLADTVTQRINDSLAARQNELSALLNAGSATFRTLAETGADDPALDDRRAAAAALLSEAANQYPAFDVFFIYTPTGEVIVSSQPEQVGESLAERVFFADSLTEPRVNPVYHEGDDHVPVLLVTAPLANGDGTPAGVVAGRVSFAPIDTIVMQTGEMTGLPVAIYLVSESDSRLVAPQGFAGLSGFPVLESDGANLGVSGQSGSGTYQNALDVPVRVVGVVRYVEPLGVALLVEVPQERLQQVALNLPTATPRPSQTPPPPAESPTPRPAIFPTDTVAEIAIAETVFEHGRMFWIRHTRQIWVMIDDPDPDYPGGDWYCFNDTYSEGEPEIDPDLTPPEGMLQPRRGFGKLWRTEDDFMNRLGWAVTPEFELTSRYTYIAGGYVENGQYVPGPGEHRMTTLYNESISFFEREIRGDCLGGTWRQTGH